MKKTPYILAVDDEEYVLQVIKRTLEPEGYVVTTAADGSSALASLFEHQPDLVLLDIKLPDTNGYQVLERIREMSDVPVIMLTAVLEVASIQQSLDLGADDYIRKPFRPRELIARVRAKLRRLGF